MSWVATLRYLGKMVTDQNCIQEEIKKRLNSGNACYYAVQNLLSSHLLSKSVKINIYKTVVLRLSLYGCETWSLTLSEEHRLKVSENRVLRGLFRPEREEVTGGWRKLRNKSTYSSLNIIRVIKSRRMKWVGHIARMGKVRNAYKFLVGRDRL
jgi:hypothetical protein